MERLWGDRAGAAHRGGSWRRSCALSLTSGFAHPHSCLILPRGWISLLPHQTGGQPVCPSNDAMSCCKAAGSSRCSDGLGGSSGTYGGLQDRSSPISTESWTLWCKCPQKDLPFLRPSSQSPVSWHILPPKLCFLGRAKHTGQAGRAGPCVVPEDWVGCGPHAGGRAKN